jgi:hypothetical protein
MKRHRTTTVCGTRRAFLDGNTLRVLTNRTVTTLDLARRFVAAAANHQQERHEAQLMREP